MKVSSFDECSWVPRAPRAPLKIIAICNESAGARPSRALRQRGARRHQVLTKALGFRAPPARPPKSSRYAMNLLTRAPRAPLARPLAEGGMKVSSFDQGFWVPHAPRAPLKAIAICNESARARPSRAPWQRGARRHQVLMKALGFRAPPARPKKSLRYAMNLLARAPRAPLGQGGHEGIKF